MISIEAEPFFRKPDFQLRAFGAFAPVVSFSRNVSSSSSRHPVIVTGADFETDAFASDSMAGAFAAVASAARVAAGTTAAADALAAAAFFDWACASAPFSECGLTVAMSVGRAGRPTAINIAAPMTQITTRRIAHAPIAPMKLEGFFEPVDLFARTDFFMR